MHLYRCDSIWMLPQRGVCAQPRISNTQWRCPQPQEVLTPVPRATRLRVVQAARPQRMGYIRFR
jgi:hypothetical protein